MKIRLRRYEMEMTQEELAEKAALHPTYVGSVERGERNIALENIIPWQRRWNALQKI